MLRVTGREEDEDVEAFGFGGEDVVGGVGNPAGSGWGGENRDVGDADGEQGLGAEG